MRPPITECVVEMGIPNRDETMTKPKVEILTLSIISVERSLSMVKISGRILEDSVLETYLPQK